MRLFSNDHLNNFKSPYAPGSESIRVLNEFFIKLQANTSHSSLSSRGQVGKLYCRHKRNRGFKMEEFQ
jgi:hypothetical protein